jgi:hypothetical protein
MIRLWFAAERDRPKNKAVVTTGGLTGWAGA